MFIIIILSLNQENVNIYLTMSYNKFTMSERGGLMEEIYGYGYITKPSHNLTRSTAYKALRGRFILQENIFIDVLESKDNKEQLKCLLGRAHHGDTIVIMNKRTLGTTKEFRQWWYEITYTCKLNLLIVDDNAPNNVHYYSTTDFSFNRYDDKAISERWERLQTDVFERQTNKVGRKSTEITDKFIDTYWAYQSFYVSVDDAFQNLGISKQTFYTMCKTYEATDQYKQALLQHIELFEYPRRGGITSDIERLFLAVEQKQMDLQDACNELEIPVLLPEEYHRYLLAKVQGRKVQFQMEAQHHIEDYFKNNQ